MTNGKNGSQFIVHGSQCIEVSRKVEKLKSEKVKGGGLRGGKLPCQLVSFLTYQLKEM